jgi:DNA-binding transcriptional regulator GbsR (MarR family)
MSDLTPPMRQFIDYFGEVGQRWGLDGSACRVHAFLYLVARASTAADIAIDLSIDEVEARRTLDYLAEWKMVDRAYDTYSVGSDPWRMLFAGIEERRRRELEPALATLRSCRAEAARGSATSASVRHRIGRVVDLVEDIASLDIVARRLSPTALRRAMTLSGRAAQFLERTLGAHGGGRHDR